MTDTIERHQDYSSDDGHDVRSISTTSSLPVTRTMQDMSIEREWDLLSSNSATTHDFNDGHSLIQQNSSISDDDLQMPAQSTFDLSVLEDWRRVTGAVSPLIPAATPSEAGVSEISVVSSNGYDPAFFPERNATPTNKAPRRGCSTRHGVLCQLCSEEIRGMRYMCKECPQWSVCTECFVITAEHEVHPVHTFIRIFSPADIFTVQGHPSVEMPTLGVKAGIKARDIIGQPTIHLDVDCFNCRGSIIGNRYDCAFVACQKAGISFCQDCEALPINCHPSDHPLIKYKQSKEASRKVYAEEDIIMPIHKDKKPTEVISPKAMKQHLNTLKQGAPSGSFVEYDDLSVEYDENPGATIFYPSEIVHRQTELSKATVPDLEHFADRRNGRNFTVEVEDLLKEVKRHAKEERNQEEYYQKEIESLQDQDSQVESENLLENFFESKTNKRLDTRERLSLEWIESSALADVS
jgi:hypothetical protein